MMVRVLFCRVPSSVVEFVHIFMFTHSYALTSPMQ